jgi:hypothetical protein
MVKDLSIGIRARSVGSELRTTSMASFAVNPARRNQKQKTFATIRKKHDH